MMISSTYFFFLKQKMD